MGKLATNRGSFQALEEFCWSPLAASSDTRPKLHHPPSKLAS